MVKIIDGKKLAENIKDDIAKQIYDFKGPRPNLAIILVGNRTDSELYVSLKEKEGKKVGVDTHLYKLDEDITEKELLEVIEWLNKDNKIDGILIQLPLPKHLDTNKIIKSIDRNKDVDGFHPQHLDYLVSPVILSIKECLKDINLSKGKACVLYNSDVFGKEVEKNLRELGFEIISSQDSSQADLLVTALGKPESIKKENIKKNATIIDIGITKKDKKVLGDVDFENVKDKALYITPVPGGIGPMTIAFLFKNVLEIFKQKKR